MASIIASISENMRSNLIYFNFLVLKKKLHSLIDSVAQKKKAKPFIYFQIKHHKRQCFLTKKYKIVSQAIGADFLLYIQVVNAFQNNFYLIRKEHLSIIKILKNSEISDEHNFITLILLKAYQHFLTAEPFPFQFFLYI